MPTPTFEQTYVKYPFAPLITLVLKLGVWLSNTNRNNDANLPTGMVHSA